MADGLNRFLGDTPGRTIVKLVVISLLVGFVMNAFGLSPFDVWHWARRAIVDLWRSGFEALGSMGRMVVLGAAIVVPVFVILRLLSYRKS